ncbi:MAG: hypothetical protein Q4F95_14495 [Oscillospiraceae bacterium]|nr:hypothetical protein [Oscillospiraceae bacterium]
MQEQTVNLNNKLRTLRSEYERNAAQMNRMRGAYEQKVNNRLESLREELGRIILEDEQKNRSSYEDEFRIYTQKVEAQLKESIAGSNIQYKKLVEENEKLRSEFEQLEKMLAARVSSIDEKMARGENTRKEEASKRMEQTYNCFAKFSASYPHEFFMPHIADALLMRMESSKSDFKRGFYEACMADSSEMMFNIAVLEDELNKKLEEYKRYFSQLEAGVLTLNEFLSSVQFRTIRNEYFEKELFENVSKQTDTLDFWSYGKYSEICEQAKEISVFVDKINSSPGADKTEKIRNVLKNAKSEEGMSLESIEERIRTITSAHKTACNVMTYIHTSFTASYMRLIQTGRSIIKQLSSIRNCAIQFKGFENSDIRNDYIIEATEPGKEITVHIFAVSPDRITVENCIGMYIRHVGSGTRENLSDTETLIKKQIMEAAPGVPLFFESNCSMAQSETQKVFDAMRTQANEKRKKEISAAERMR